MHAMCKQHYIIYERNTLRAVLYVCITIKVLIMRFCFWLVVFSRSVEGLNNLCAKNIKQSLEVEEQRNKHFRNFGHLLARIKMIIKSK